MPNDPDESCYSCCRFSRQSYAVLPLRSGASCIRLRFLFISLLGCEAKAACAEPAPCPRGNREGTWPRHGSAPRLPGTRRHRAVARSRPCPGEAQTPHCCCCCWPPACPERAEPPLSRCWDISRPATGLPTTPKAASRRSASRSARGAPGAAASWSPKREPSTEQCKCYGGVCGLVSCFFFGLPFSISALRSVALCLQRSRSAAPWAAAPCCWPGAGGTRQPGIKDMKNRAF